MKCTYIKDAITESEAEWYTHMNSGWQATRDSLKVENGNNVVTYVIFRGPFTSACMCRDCGEYYEIQDNSTYLKIPYSHVH